MKFTRFRLRKFLTWCWLTLTAWLIVVAWDIWSFGNHDHANPSDCAIVLGAAVDGSVPSPVFMERIRHAVTLYQNGTVATIIFTGGFGKGEPNAESLVGANYARLSGIPPAAILTETNSHTTRQNLSEAKFLMTSSGLHSAIIVSDPLHLRRASIMARDLGIQSVTSPTPTSRYRSMMARLGFLIRELYFLHHYRISGN